MNASFTLELRFHLTVSFDKIREIERLVRQAAAAIGVQMQSGPITVWTPGNYQRAELKGEMPIERLPAFWQSLEQLVDQQPSLSRALITTNCAYPTD